MLQITNTHLPADGQPRPATSDRAIGLSIRRLREAHGLTRGELARLIHDRPGHVADYETGRTRVRAEVLYEITEALATTLSGDIRLCTRR